MAKADILICGGGIIGITVAKELLNQGYENIVIIEKEKELGLHASGRNSGVLHSGIYYASDTLKAKSCIKGNLLMQEYCKKKGLPLLNSGKVIVAKDDSELKTLYILFKRALNNGAKVKLIDEKELSTIEPNAKTYEKALFSNNTAVVSPKLILQSLYNDVVSSGKAKIFLNTEFQGIKATRSVLTNIGEIEFNIFINAGGAFSDKIAHAFEVGQNYKLIPFKGIYKKLRSDKANFVNGNIYPVPDIRNPFLGIHFTKSIDRNVYLGPTAIPAFGRENYGIVKGMDIEAGEILLREAILFFENPKFRSLALIEPRKYLSRFFYRDARELVKDLHPCDVMPSSKAGIRPQLVDWKDKELVMDFKIIKDGSCIHILNAISPAFTCSLDFAKFVVNEYI
ncbi:MAG: L-2-hydroxyglutarate oxidase [Spirochaetota bacterium]|nr:L-2-hydroxyglutarate oxidase [Spirochaetota bacterium]